jgi:cytochrome P450
MVPFSEYLERLPLPPVRRFRKARERLDKIVYRMIAERRASGHDSGDLLSMLLLAQDETQSPDGTYGMTDEQVRDEAMTLMLAGHETTANVLTWAWYLLSQNPEAEARFHKELGEVLNGRLATFEDIPRLEYTGHVFGETLRLYPAVWVIGRKPLEDFQAGPYTVPAQSWVITSPFVMHRDPRWFPDPLQFRPERWETEGTRPKFAYLPFGAGLRGCIGERLAWMESVLTLATLGQKWRLKLAPGHRVDMLARMTLRPKFGMRMVAEARG